MDNIIHIYFSIKNVFEDKDKDEKDKFSLLEKIKDEMKELYYNNDKSMYEDIYHMYIYTTHIYEMYEMSYIFLYLLINKDDLETIFKLKIDYNKLNILNHNIKNNNNEYTNVNLGRIYKEFRFNENNNLIQHFEDSGVEDTSEAEDNYIESYNKELYYYKYSLYFFINKVYINVEKSKYKINDVYYEDYIKDLYKSLYEKSIIVMDYKINLINQDILNNICDIIHIKDENLLNNFVYNVESINDFYIKNKILICMMRCAYIAIGFENSLVRINSYPHMVNIKYLLNNKELNEDDFINNIINNIINKNENVKRMYINFFEEYINKIYLEMNEECKNKNCCICFEEFLENENNNIHSYCYMCKNYYHKDCYYGLYDNNNHCALCNRSINIYSINEISNKYNLFKKMVEMIKIK